MKICFKGKPTLYEGTNIFDVALKARPWKIVESLYLGYPRNGNSYPPNGKTTVYGSKFNQNF